MSPRDTSNWKWEHGTRYGYVSGCRCDDCTAANTVYYRKRRKVLRLTPSTMIPHGAGGYTNYACRCDICRRAHTEANRRRYA